MLRFYRHVPLACENWSGMDVRIGRLAQLVRALRSHALQCVEHAPYDVGDWFKETRKKHLPMFGSALTGSNIKRG